MCRVTGTHYLLRSPQVGGWVEVGLCLTLVVVKLLLFLIHMYLTLGGLWTQIARAIE